MDGKIFTLAAAAVLTLSSCGAIGRGDPTAVTKKTAEYSQPDESLSEDSSTSQDDSSRTQEAVDETAAAVEALMEEMTDEQKVGQLFIVRADALETDFSNETVYGDSTAVTFVDDEMKAALESYHVGGVVIVQKNITDSEQLKELTGDLQEESEIPLFVTVTEEGGRYSDLANSDVLDVDVFESMYSVGESGDTEQAKNVGEVIGEYLSEYGFNLNLAPVADVFSNTDNSIIGDRAFSSDPETAAQMVVAEIEGLKSQGVMSAVKHFPGHGDVTGGVSTVGKTAKDWVELMECELIPFIAAFAETDMVMVGHINASNVTDDGLPASLSSQMIEDKLRDELGYEGVVITDSMAATAITSAYNSGECAVRAINAGADIVLEPYDLEEAYTTVLEAVENGTISEERLNESVERILTLKAENGLIG